LLLLAAPAEFDRHAGRLDFAGNFTPIPKNKIAQVDCSPSCLAAFDTCVRVRGVPTPPPTVGTQQVAPPTVPLVIGPNCEFDRDACLRGCAAIRTNPPVTNPPG
jgi:hypothetical protein